MNPENAHVRFHEGDAVARLLFGEHRSSEPVCYIVGAGANYGLDFIANKGDYVIAADGGFAHLRKAGIEADLAIGDFDSLGEKPEAKKVVSLNSEKDDTDTLAALRSGIAKGYRSFCIYCGTGGRFEHTLANIQCLAFLANNGKRGWLVDKDVVMTALSNGSVCFGDTCRGFVSVFAHTEKAKGVSIKGLKYEVENAELSSDFPLGISNEFIGKPGRIHVKDGVLLVVYPR